MKNMFENFWISVEKYGNKGKLVENNFVELDKIKNFRLILTKIQKNVKKLYSLLIVNCISFSSLSKWLYWH